MKKPLTELLNEADAKVKALEADLAQANDANQKAAAELTAKSEEIINLNKCIDDLKQAEATAINAKLESEKKAIELQGTIDALKAEAKTAEEKAAQILGDVAAKPAGASPQESKPTAEELWAQYHKLPEGQPRMDFYNQHRDVLTPKEAQAR